MATRIAALARALEDDDPMPELISLQCIDFASLYPSVMRFKDLRLPIKIDQVGPIRMWCSVQSPLPWRSLSLEETEIIPRNPHEAFCGWPAGLVPDAIAKRKYVESASELAPSPHAAFCGWPKWLVSHKDEFAAANDPGPYRSMNSDQLHGYFCAALKDKDKELVASVCNVSLDQARAALDQARAALAYRDGDLVYAVMDLTEMGLGKGTGDEITEQRMETRVFVSAKL